MLLAVCTDPNLLQVVLIAKKIIQILEIVGPLGVVLYASIDVVKAVTSKDQSSIKKQLDMIPKRLLAMAILFFVPMLVDITMSIADNEFEYSACFKNATQENIESLFVDMANEKIAEEQKARKINFAAMRAMDGCKKRGQVILVFPSGTRYRPGKPETKRGLREIDSYLRLFDKMILVSINGNCLRINPDNPDDMLADILEPGKCVFTASPVIDCKEFRNNILDNLPEGVEDPKQKTVDAVMEYLEKQHSDVGA